MAVLHSAPVTDVDVLWAAEQRAFLNVRAKFRGQGFRSRVQQWCLSYVLAVDPDGWILRWLSCQKSGQPDGGTFKHKLQRIQYPF